MAVNETSTTAALFLGVLLLAIALSSLVSIQRGEPAWPFASEEVEPEPAKAPLFVGRPYFGPGQYNLKTDHDPEEAAAEIEPLLRPPPLDTLGLSLALIGTVWLCIEAFGQRVGWGVATLVLNVIGGVAFLFAYPSRAWRPIVVQCTGYAALLWATLAAR